MGEVAVSSDCREDMNLVVRETEVEAEAEAQKMKEDGSASVVRWEKFLPKMVLRVLLVESDDSTRQIIAALLRKCSYRVAAVGDGLKAWELLKGKPQSIDLILTEVDLPSISGFALLTLIMEHEICKNIPVIMMSSHDSVSMVYKCMLRGAADFLVKPVRINELRNLWQHVWRRQVSGSSGHGLQDESVAQEKVEATAENNAVSNSSSGYVACVKRNKECIEKGTDAQSSCTKPDLEVESVNTENLHDLLQSRCFKSPENDMNTRNKEECANSNKKYPVHDNEDMGLVVAVNEDINARIQEENVTAEGKRERTNAPIEACNNNNAFVSMSREAIDFIGAFNNHPPSNLRSCSSNNVTNMIDPSPMLDLSLRRSHPSGSVNQVNDESHMLNHSDASAFSRYVNRAPMHSPASICNQQRDYGTISDRHCSDHTLNYNSDAHTSPLSSQKNIFCSVTGQSQQAGVSFPSRQQTVISIPVPMRGTRLDGLCPAYGSAVSPTACKQSEVSPVQSPGSACHPSNIATKNSQQVYNLIDQNFNNSTKQYEQYQWRKLESSGDQRHFSSAADQSASSSFCNSIAGHLTSIGCGNNGSVDQVTVGSSAAESGNEEGTTVFDKNYHRSVQREAALTKFRLKRKERCFEKKVRYESRKKLAEQRPRVKGQFVRQTHAEPAAVETETQCGN